MGENREKRCNRKFCADFECVTLTMVDEVFRFARKAEGA